MLDSDWFTTSAPLGDYDSITQSWKALGSGVFIYDDPFIWYVTANHLIKNDSNDPIHILINHVLTKRYLINIESLQQQKKIEWIVDASNNLAATLFPSDPLFTIKAINFLDFLDSSNIFLSMNCYTIAYPYNLADSDMDKVKPYVLDGIISGIDSQENRIYSTAPTFPGNSGSPLFVLKSTQSNENVFLGGIISKYILIGNGSEKDNNSLTPPMHLGVVIPSEIIKKLLVSPKSQNMKEKIR